MNTEQYKTNVAIREHWHAEVLRLRRQIETLLAAVKATAAAMRKAVKHGNASHFDCCDDGGAFWYDALDAADAAVLELEGGAT